MIRSDPARTRTPRTTVWLAFLAAFVAVLVSGCGGSDSPASAGPSPTPVTPAATPTPAAAARPNVVVVMADDLDAGAVAYMPNLQSLLVRRGLRFSNAFASTPLCAPARASILTGLHPHNHGVRRNQRAAESFRGGPEASSLAPTLQAAGYRTALVGKYLNQYAGDVVPPGWDEWHAVFSTSGSDAYYDYFIRTRDGIDSFGSDPDDYLTDVLAQRAEDVVARADEPDQPLFLLLATSAPHTPAVPAPRHAGQLSHERAPRDPSFNEGDVDDKPAHVRNLPLLTDQRIADMDAHFRDRLRSMLAVDDAIGRLVTALDESGRLENTYFFFTSDNGFMFGHHRYYWGKNTPYEPSLRIPLIVRGPNVPRGVTRGHMVTLVDLGATIHALARVTPATSPDGKDLAPLLGAAPPPVDEWRQAILIEHNPGGAPSAQSVPDYEGLRTPTSVFVRYATAELELYDLERDPDQLQSLHARVEDDAIDTWLARLDEVRHCRGAACP